MDDPRLLERLGVALAIGLLVGVERHWRERDAAPGKRAAGLRTFGLIGLTGGVAAAVSPDPVWLGLVLLAVVAPVAWFERAEAAASGSVSVTTVTAAALTCALGALAVLGQVTAAAAAAVGAVGLLALRERLHGFVSRLTWPELRSAIVLLAMTLIAMPVIPDREYPELGGLNPARLWLFTVILAGVSFAGYVAARMFGA
ncbi:MAG: MgtC/SapB family protein, partial [Acetobacteraceae bacterium]|nr:MgtC/SapB family protein [Acetobacteraceae bacterium]